MSYFPEANIIERELLVARAAGQTFDLAWRAALRAVKAERHPRAGYGGLAEARWKDVLAVFRFSRPAYERAYERKPPTRLDLIARALLHAIELMYDESEEVAPTAIEELMEAA